MDSYGKAHTVTITDGQGTNPQGVSQSQDGGSGTSAPTFTVKVNGQEMSVNQDELIAGYQRQTDYTRKMQDLANQRRENQRALAIAAELDRDPHGAIQQIAQHYNIQPPTAPAATSLGYDEATGDVGTSDPNVSALQQQIAQLTGQLQHLATNQQTSRLEGDLARIEQTYGAENVDREAVLRHMKVNNISNPEVAYRDLAFDSAAAAMTADVQRKAAEEQILAEKRANQGLVATGASVSGEATEHGEKSYDDPKRSFKDLLGEAFRDSMDESGVKNLDDPALIWG